MLLQWKFEKVDFYRVLFCSVGIKKNFLVFSYKCLLIVYIPSTRSIVFSCTEKRKCTKLCMISNVTRYYKYIYNLLSFYKMYLL